MDKIAGNIAFYALINSLPNNFSNRALYKWLQKTVSAGGFK